MQSDPLVICFLETNDGPGYAVAKSSKQLAGRLRAFAVSRAQGAEKFLIGINDRASLLVGVGRAADEASLFHVARTGCCGTASSGRPRYTQLCGACDQASGLSSSARRSFKSSGLVNICNDPSGFFGHFSFGLSQ